MRSLTESRVHWYSCDNSLSLPDNIDGNSPPILLQIVSEFAKRARTAQERITPDKSDKRFGGDFQVTSWWTCNTR